MAAPVLPKHSSLPRCPQSVIFIEGLSMAKKIKKTNATPAKKTTCKKSCKKSCGKSTKASACSLKNVVEESIETNFATETNKSLCQKLYDWLFAQKDNDETAEFYRRKS